MKFTSLLFIGSVLAGLVGAMIVALKDQNHFATMICALMVPILLLIHNGITDLKLYLMDAERTVKEIHGENQHLHLLVNHRNHDVKVLREQIEDLKRVNHELKKTSV